jgi:hypothetical protein
LRYEDVHGVSGDAPEGEVVAEVVEFSNGKVVVAWQSKAPSVNAYDNIKYVETTHGHGGKSEIDWVWESEADPDPMDKIFEKKIRDAGGNPTKNGKNGRGNGNGVAFEDVAEDAAEAAANELTRLVTAKTAEKLAARVRETEEAEKREGDKKPAASKKKDAVKKPTNGKKKE